VSAVAENLAQLIHREGPITFDRFMEIALYG
jgi:SAM-dependent MidA family methyltransferase